MSGRKAVMFPFCALLLTVWAFVPTGKEAWGTHSNESDLASICYDCHTLNAILADNNTSFINSSSRTLPQMRSVNGAVSPGNYSPTGKKFGCTYCHNDALRTIQGKAMKDAITPFLGRTSQHPFDRSYTLDANRNLTLGANTGSTLYMSNWDNSWVKPSGQIDCVGCHDADGNGGTYPNHPASDNGSRSAGANPFMLRNTTAMDNGHAPDSFCLATCHAGTAAGTSGWKMGHYGWGAYDNTTGGMADNTLKEPGGTPLKTSKCADCHETHSSGLANLMGEGKQSRKTINTANCTAVCHDSATFTGKGHGVKGVVCEDCHSASVSHRDNTAGNPNPKRLKRAESGIATTVIENFLGNGRDDNFNGVIDDAAEGTLIYSSESLCTATCHTEKHAHSGNIGGQEGVASCFNCHDPHGNGIDNNTRFLRRTIRPNGTTKTVKYWGTNDTYRSDGAGICDTPACHNNSSFEATKSYVSDHVGKTPDTTNCLSCHNHSAAPGESTPSFSPVCNTCHDHPDYVHIANTHPLSAVHTKHAGTAAQGGYHLSCGTCHLRNNHNQSGMIYTGQAPVWNILDNSVDIRFASTMNPRWDNGATSYPRYNNVAADNTQATPAPGVGGTGHCDGLYCHGNSTAAQAWSGKAVTGPTWNGTAPCGACHGVTAADPPINSAHPKHVTENGYPCQVCHYSVTNDGATIADRTKHVNNSKDVDNNAAGPSLFAFTYSTGSPGSCVNASCHGGNAAPVAWNAGTQACGACHGGAADVNDFTRDNTAISKVNTGEEWTVYGHGAKAGVTCSSCHSSSVPHDNSATLSGSNPFRLTSGFTCSNINTGCHANAPAKDVVTHSDNAMLTAGYTAKRAWPAWKPECVNCHDPHGDATNASMIQKELYDKASFGLPAGPPPAQPTEQTTLVFTDNSLGVGLNSYAWSTTNTPNYSGVCQECHEDPNHLSFKDGVPATGQATSPVGSNHPGAGGNPGDCRACHKHDSAFKPSGCNGCHGSTGNGQYWPAAAPGTYPNRAGAHDNHVNAIGSWLYGQTAATGLLTDAGGTADAKQKAICGWCHPNPGDPRTGTGETTHADYVAPVDVHGDGRAGASASYMQYYNGNTTTPGSDNNAAATYDNNSLSCSNARCHNNVATPTGANNWRTPPAWSTTSCGTAQCHATPAWSGAHTTHYAAKDAGMAYPCSECHVVPASLRHGNGQVNLLFGVLEATRGGGNGYYDKDGSNSLTGTDNDFKAYDNVYNRSCANIYCHGGDSAWGGSNTKPTWDNAAHGDCGTCHGVYGSPYNDNGVARNPIATGNHQVHFTQYDSGKLEVASRGPRLKPHPGDLTQGGCVHCHNINGAGSNCTTACHSTGAGATQPTGTHADGNIDFRDNVLSPPLWGTDPYSVNTLAATPACNNCHSTATVVTRGLPSPGKTGVAASKENWNNTSYRLDCLTCHNGIVPANSKSGGDGIAAPNEYGNGSDYGAETRGHNRASGSNYPESGNPAGNRLCSDCHDVSSMHINHVADNTYSGNRLPDNVNSVTGITTVSGLCAACHTNTGSSTASHNNVNTHGNSTAASSFKTGNTHDNNAEDFAYNCNACHEPHGMTANGRPLTASTGANIFMIKLQVEVRNYSFPATGADNTTASGPIYFEAMTGANSFDDNTSGNSNRLCVACHVDTNRPGTGTSLAVTGGAHAGLDAYNQDERGKNCASCHTHNLDSGSSTIDGLMPLACNGCHTYPGLATSGAHRLTASHDKHAGRPGDETAVSNKGYACGQCHKDSSHNDAGVAGPAQWNLVDNNAHVQVRFDNTWNPATANPDNTSQDSSSYNDTTNTCSNLYCHGDTLAGAGGSKTKPTWTVGDAACGMCHASTSIGTGNHAAHLTAAYGPNFGNGGCGSCHTAYDLSSTGTHVNRGVEFANVDNSASAYAVLGATVPASPPGGTSTDRCNHCHSTATVNGFVGTVLAKANWDNAAYKLDCLTCHNGTDAGTTGANGTGRAAPDMLGDDANYGAEVTGHNRPSGSNYASGNPPAQRSCTVCHGTGIPHIDGTDNTGFTGNRLLDNVNNVTGITTVSGLCAACHTNSGASPATKKSINTHGNAGFTDNLEAKFSDRTCDQCHEPHGMVNVTAAPAGVNLWMINPTIKVTSTDNVSPVRLFAKTGANSFDNTGTSSDLCRACHAHANNPGYPMKYNVAGQHAAPGYSGDERGKDCSGCHSHNQDDNTATVDGLMPLACNACHSYPGIDNSASKKQMSAAHGKHTGTPTDTTNTKGYACTLCHYNYNHNQSRIGKGADWPLNYYDNVNIDFDPSWNPGSPTYRTQSVPTTGNGGTGACGGLYCHGDNPTSTPGWGGSDNTPVWNLPSTGACGTCHDAGTADTTPGTVFSTKNHPVHVDNASKPYGPGLAAFSAGGNCAEGTGCHTKYGLTSASLHANNAKNLRSTASDNGEVGATLATTQVCRNCHATYASTNVPTSGDNLVRTQANWDNNAYFVPCVTCHNGTAAGTQATAGIGGSGGRAAAIEGTYYYSGHGLYGSPAPLACGSCHANVGHIGSARPTGTNPWRLGFSNFSTLGSVDNACSSTACHGSSTPNNHTWIVGGGGYATSKEAGDTHPTTVAAVGADKDRWYQVPSSAHVPLFGNLLDNSYNKSGGTNNYVLCVSCHDPHGVGTSPVPSAVRAFSGQNNDLKGNKMLRFDYSSGTPTALCSQCHK